MEKSRNATVSLDSKGYRLDGDNVELNALLRVNRNTSLASWKLQLWASETQSATEPSRIKVAETTLETAQISDGVARVHTQLAAVLPPTGRYYDMALVLAESEAGQEREGDSYRFPERQWISGPFMQGLVAYDVVSRQVTIEVESVCNPRNDDNVSGTLALELWALPQPYFGGTPQGHHTAGVLFGTLAGQSSRSSLQATLDFTEPPPGRWHLVLMLREWTAAGYVTRDYRAFDALYQVNVSPTAAGMAPPVQPNQSASRAAELTVKPVADKAAEAPVVAKAVVAKAPESPVAAKPAVVKAGNTPVVAAKPVAAKAAEPAVAAKAVAVKAAEPAVAAKPVVVEAAQPKAPAKAAVVQPVAAPAAASEEDTRVCVQSATVEELARVRGLSKKVAQEIVKTRPFSSLDDLVHVRGIGVKSLRALRSLLKL